MFCNKCGSIIDDGLSVCPRCGEIIFPLETQNANTITTAKRKKTIIIIPLVVVLIVAAGIAFGYFNDTGKRIPPQSSNNIVTGSENQTTKKIVDESLLTVEITLPKDLFMGQTPSTSLTEKQKADGYISATLNADGSVTYKVKKSCYNNLVQETKTSTIQNLKDIVTSGDYPSVKKIDYNNNFSKVTMYVNKESYNNGFDSMASLNIVLAVGFYDAIANIKSDCQVLVVDINTNKVIDTYPKK